MNDNAPEQPSDQGEGRPRFDFAAFDRPPESGLFEPPILEPPYARHVLTTPVHTRVAACSRTNRWAEWSDHTTPLVFTSVDDEYAALRGRAALSDISPLPKFRISGRDAATYLNRLVTSDVRGLARGKARYVLFCEERGFIVGDGVLFHMAADDYRLIASESHADWLLDSAHGFKVLIEDVGRSIAGLAVQGPAACAVLRTAGFPAVETLEPRRARWAEVRGMPVYVSRTGQSGDLGYELWVDAEDAPLLWDWLMTTGGPLGLAPAGLAARELARIEAGIPRIGIDFLSAFAAVDPASARTPYDLGLGASVDFRSGPFTGRDALRDVVQKGAPRGLIGLEIETGEPAAVGVVYANGARAGFATSAAWSPLLNRTVALATVSMASLTADVKYSADAELRRELAVEQRRLAARHVDRPFLDLPRKHATPPLLV